MELKIGHRRVPITTTTVLAGVCCLLLILVTSEVILLNNYNKERQSEVKGASTENTAVSSQEPSVNPISTPVSTDVPIKAEVPVAPVVEPVAVNPPVKPQPAAPVKPTQPAPTPPPVPPPAPPPVPQSCDTAFNAPFLKLINDYRVANGKPALSINSNLNSAACGHSTWMSSTGNFSHTGANGSTSASRCSAAGSSCDAENVAMDTDPSAAAESFFNQWKNSAGHNANMLGDHTIIGIGRSGYYATTDFK